MVQKRVLAARLLPLSVVSLALAGCSVASTSPATFLTDQSATLNGTVYSTENAADSGNDPITYSDDHAVTYWFQYGTSTDYDTTTPHHTLHVPVHAFHTGFPVSEPIQGLDASSDYHYRICAQDTQPGVPANCGPDQTLTTSIPGGASGLAYTTTRYTGDGTRIWRMDADGSNKQELQETLSGSSPSWAPNGRAIAFDEGEGQFDRRYVAVIDPDGSSFRQLTDPGSINAQAPAWSPGLNLIAYEQGQSPSEIWLMDQHGNNQVALTHPGADANDSEVAWSPDAERLCFTRRPAAGGQATIWVVNADGSDPHQISPDPASDDECNWSPDGTRIYFRHSGHEWTMNPDGSDRTQLGGPDDPVFADSRLSPDGTHLTYTGHDPNGKVDIFLGDAEGLHSTDLTPSAPLAYRAAWSPRP